VKTLTCVTVALIALMLLVRPEPAIADATFGITPDKKLGAALANLADTCFECGDEAKGKGLYTCARSYFNHALEYDVDHKKTRRVMGYERKKGAWVLEEDMVPKEDKVGAGKEREMIEKLQADTTPIREKAAATIWPFVEDTKLAPAQRMLALYHTLRIFPEHRAAQKAARSAPDKYWFKHHLDDEGDTQRAVWIQRAIEGEVVETETQYDKQSGIPFAKRKSGWLFFHMDIGEKSGEWARVLLQFTEAARGHVFELLGVEAPRPPEKDLDRLHFTVLSQRERFARFVEKCSGINDAALRKDTAEVSGGGPTYNPYGTVWLYPDLANDFGLRDGLAHDIAAKEIFRYCGMGAYWLARGLGYMNSTHMNGSVQSRFWIHKSTGVIDSAGREALPGMGDCAAGWRVEIGMQVAAEAELTLSALASVRDADFSQRETAAAFCFTDYLLHGHKAKLGEFLKSCYDERVRRNKEKLAPETPGETVERLYKVLETTEADFQQAFRVWVLKEYFALP
jgi:hypothetical protein